MWREVTIQFDGSIDETEDSDWSPDGVEWEILIDLPNLRVSHWNGNRYPDYTEWVIQTQ